MEKFGCGAEEEELILLQHNIPQKSCSEHTSYLSQNPHVRHVEKEEEEHSANNSQKSCSGCKLNHSIKSFSIFLIHFFSLPLVACQTWAPVEIRLCSALGKVRTDVLYFVKF